MIVVAWVVAWACVVATFIAYRWARVARRAAGELRELHRAALLRYHAAHADAIEERTHNVELWAAAHMAARRFGIPLDAFGPELGSCYEFCQRLTAAAVDHDDDDERERHGR